MGEKSSKKAINLTRYLISLPDSRFTILSIFLISILFGLLFGFLSGKISDLASIFYTAGNGLFVLAIPTLISAMIIFAIKRKLLFRRIVFLCFATMIIYALAYAASLLLTEPINFIIILLGFGLVFGFWYLVFNTVFGLTKLALLFALIQLTLNSMFLLVSEYIFIAGDPFSILIKIYFASAVFFAGIYIFLLFINAPMKRIFGIKSTEAFNMFISQWLYKSKELEETFEDIGETIETQVGIARFKGKTQDVLFVVPYIHFGPFGNLGGSEFSYLISEEFPQECFIFHGTATHDFNPVSSSELIKITDAIKKGIKEMKLKTHKTPVSYTHLTLPTN